MSAHVGISFATLEHLGPILERSRQNCGRGHRPVVWKLMRKSQKSHNIQFRPDKTLHSNCLEKSRLALKNAQDFFLAGLRPAPRQDSRLGQTAIFRFHCTSYFWCTFSELHCIFAWLFSYYFSVLTGFVSFVNCACLVSFVVCHEPIRND